MNIIRRILNAKYGDFEIIVEINSGIEKVNFPKEL